MRAYVCVYRHSTPLRSERNQTEAAAPDNALLRRYLDRYDEPDCFYDWGDDPSFYCASELLGDARMATWGVCRRDVRAALSRGDYVVFVCARHSPPRTWDYFFIGVATLGRGLSREEIWSQPELAVYRKFLNILARPGPTDLQQYETIRRFHPDWRMRARAPYWLLDDSLSSFNLEQPLLSATYSARGGGLEQWRTSDPRVRELRALLLRGATATRSLRSVNGQQAHPKLPLDRGYRTDDQLKELRATLLDIVGDTRP